MPDPCAGASPTLQGRQNQVVTRFVNSGGQSVPYYVGYAGTLGYNVTVTEFTPLRIGPALASWGNAVLERELREVVPAHTILNLAYRSTSFAARWCRYGRIAQSLLNFIH